MKTKEQAAAEEYQRERWDHGSYADQEEPFLAGVKWARENNPNESELLGALLPLIRHSCACPRSSCLRKILTQAEIVYEITCGAEKALAAYSKEEG